MNGNPKSTTFDFFWQELEATLAVDKKRHGTVMHMPPAISIRNLQEIVTARLKEKCTDSSF